MLILTVNIIAFIEAGKEIFMFLVNIFVRHIFLCRKVALKKDSFNDDRYDRIYWTSSFQKTEGWL